MWDFFRTLIPALIAIIPSYFLYRQNKESSQRESTDRQAERDLDKERREHELALKRMDIEAAEVREARQFGHQEMQDRRERVVRFAQAARKVALEMRTAIRAQEWYQLSSAERKELTDAYELARIGGGDILYPLDDIWKQIHVVLEPGEAVDIREVRIQGLEEAVDHLAEAY